ncbi:short-subunit dehydrogenase involved in D-alanine esterification of teichoic acids [Nonomuraea soli]|uniref:Short-subunit dehydrogenase involved in D-alanine esterification of teichoic acids n=1 Tax=Nonomuraea soli TaxID=1032476 RepID=A0A7W0CHP8_9ACTN|nr:short-subunit dehydrogenase involved in D-alanine esterification of teichoic acids [Nonomuraea soli]
MPGQGGGTGGTSGIGLAQARHHSERGESTTCKLITR